MNADLLARIRDGRAELDRLHPLTGDALRRMQKYYDVELTFTSNAIEGNTLTLRETAEVIEHGITVGGKRLAEHLEGGRSLRRTAVDAGTGGRTGAGGRSCRARTAPADRGAQRAGDRGRL